MNGPVRITLLHHSTGGIVWAGGTRGRLYRAWDEHVPTRAKILADRLAGPSANGRARAFLPAGVPDFLRRWNASHGTDYRIRELTYPATTGGYPWSNYPFDYWNLWVKHRGGDRDRGELNLDDLVKASDVIVFKHCFPVSRILPDDGRPDVSSAIKTSANYSLQYEALKERLHQFPDKRFVVWTGPLLARRSTSSEEARRAREFFVWVRERWDEKGDNVFVWDFYSLEVDSEGFLDPRSSSAPGDSHPSPAFARTVAPLIGRRIVDVIEGRGDTGDLTGRAPPLAASGER